MRSFKIALIVVLCIIILGLCVLLGLGLSGRSFGNGQGMDMSADYHLSLKKEIPVEGLDSIDINYGKNSNDVRIYEGSGDMIVIQEYANYKVPENEMTSVSVDGSVLEIEGRKRVSWGFHFFYIGNGGGYTEVYLPKEYRGDLEICTASGDVAVDCDLNLEGSLKVTVASGDIRMKDVSAGGAEFTSASGEIKLQKLEAAEMSVTTASGDVWIKEINGRLQCNTASGDVDVADGFGYGEIETASGDVKVFLSELTGDFSIGTASGDVTLKLPSESSFTFEAETASGDIDTYFDDALQFSKRGDHAGGVVGGDSSGMTVKIQTASGDIQVLKNHETSK